MQWIRVMIVRWHSNIVHTKTYFLFMIISLRKMERRQTLTKETYRTERQFEVWHCYLGSQCYFINCIVFFLSLPLELFAVQYQTHFRRTERDFQQQTIIGIR